ncbi:MAG TPA: DUF4097 family beta strand repeat-containing protein [Symbiobacteriaceae bacterium]|nr:DUF4097 family beta strand repeat-containing protein [Symbiobacteriaceae bacterium]
MSEERKLILQMVAEGKVTPAEADKLLQALDESEREASSNATEQARRAQETHSVRDLTAIINGAVGEGLKSLEGTLRDLEIDLNRRLNDPAREQLLGRIEEKMRRSAERAVEQAHRADERARRIAERMRNRTEHFAAGVLHLREGELEGGRIVKVGICIDRVSVAQTKQFAMLAEPGDRFHLENRVGDVRVEFYSGNQIEVTVRGLFWGEDEADASKRAGAFHMELVRQGSDVIMAVARPTITATGVVSIKESRLEYTVRVPHGTDLDIRCKAGDLVVGGEQQVGRWHLATKVGDVEVKLAPGAGFAYDLSTNVGDVRVAMADDQPAEADTAVKKGAYRTGRVGDGSGRIEISVRTGNVRIVSE